MNELVKALAAIATKAEKKRHAENCTLHIHTHLIHVTQYNTYCTIHTSVHGQGAGTRCSYELDIEMLAWVTMPVLGSWKGYGCKSQHGY